jgi:hypothetical protein
MLLYLNINPFIDFRQIMQTTQLTPGRYLVKMPENDEGQPFVIVENGLSKRTRKKLKMIPIKADSVIEITEVSF